MDNNGQPITDDADLAKVLEGMQAPTASPAPVTTNSGLSFEETPATNSPLSPGDGVVPTADTGTTETSSPAPTVTPGDPALTVSDVATVSYAPANDPALEAIKKDALEQLRPLVDRLNLPADEKFDTLLLILRSTDDKSLVTSAYETAKLITDEAKRAEAMLDIIKEIDYFANPVAGQPQL